MSGDNFSGGHCLGGNYPGGNCPRTGRKMKKQNKTKQPDCGGVFGTLLTNLLYKPFDCIPHELITANCQTGSIWFQIDALKLLHDYLPKRKQTVKLNNF